MKGAAILEVNMADGQKRNITKVINEYSSRLLGFIRRRVNTDADAEDILQDVFYRLVGNTEPIEQLTSWLFRVARNRITDTKRKNKPDLLDDIYTDEDGEEMMNWTELFASADNNPETEYLRALFWEELQNALDELPEEQRQVFILNEMEGIPFKELSEKTGLSVNTLLSRKRYAVLHLRDRLRSLRDQLMNY
jgi:RNA polymerase sigma factor (sigma-70 family)